MKSYSKVLLAFIIVIAIQTAFAEIPQLINYQGRLTDAGGVPVADGVNLVKFIIYDAAVAGAEKWNSGFQNVTTKDGLFSYDLGSNTPLPDDLFTDALRYLGITVGIDPEISPRTRLESVPYAYQALRADTALVVESSTGVTQSLEEGDIIVTGFLNLLTSDSINCPADGFVMVNVTLVINCNHTSGDDDVVFAVIVDNSLTVLQDQDNRAWSLPGALPTGSYSTFVHVHKVFPVSAGWNTYTLLGFHNIGGGTDNFATSDQTTSLLFIPQSFGDVAVGVPTPPSSPMNSLPRKF